MDRAVEKHKSNFENARNSVIVTCVKNPFDAAQRETRVVEFGNTIGELIKTFYPKGADGYDIVVAVNGLTTHDLGLDYIPKYGTSVAFCLVPQGGGKGGKAVIGLVAMIAVMIVAPYAGSVVGGMLSGGATSFSAAMASGLGTAALYSAGYAIGFGAVVIAGGMLLSAIAPNAPSIGDQNSGGSPTYSWNTVGNYALEGGALPYLYGTHRVVPPLISKYIDTDGNKQYLNLLYAVAGHRLDSITDIVINDVPIQYFSGVETDIRLGMINQSVIPAFNESRYDKYIGQSLQRIGTSTAVSWSLGDTWQPEFITDWFEVESQYYYKVTISNVVVNSPYSCTITTSAAHGFSNNDYVDIYGVSGISNINGHTYQISNVSSNAFDIPYAPGYSFSGSYTSGGICIGGWVIRETDGNQVEGMNIGIFLPKGLYYANDSGTLSPQTVRLFIDYQEVNEGETWHRVGGINNSPRTVTTGQWFARAYLPTSEYYQGSYSYVVYETGGTDPDEHYQNEPWSTPFISYTYQAMDYTSYEMRDFTGSFAVVWDWIASSVTYDTGTYSLPYCEITASQTEAFRRVFPVSALNNLSPGQYRVRVRLCWWAEPLVRYANDVQFELIQEITNDAFTYPGVALLGVRALATDQLSGGMPRISCLASRNTVPVWAAAGGEVSGSDYDNFVTDNNPMVGWTTCVSYDPLQTLLYKAVVTGPDTWCMMTRDGSFNDDQSSSAYFYCGATPTTVEQGLMVRMQPGSVSGYILAVYSEDGINWELSLFEVSDDYWTELSHATIPLPSGVTESVQISLVAFGEYIMVIVDGEDIGMTIKDSNWTSGNPGIYAYNNMDAGMGQWADGTYTFGDVYISQPATNPAWVSYHLLHRAEPVVSIVWLGGA